MSENTDVHSQRDNVLVGGPVHFRGLPAAGSVSLKLSETEAKVLSAWCECQSGFGFGFSVAAKRSGVEEHRIRRAVRALARKGALEFARTLFDEDDGEMLGAGYTITEAGRAHLDATTLPTVREE